MNSKNCKFIFLSGTPLVNKPSEIAILFNMLRGNMEIYNFSINDNLNIEDLENKLKNKFYKRNSTIEQLSVTKNNGKPVISFTRNHSNFTSIMKNDIVKTVHYNQHSFDDFIKEIYNGLKGYNVTPSFNDFKKEKLKIEKNKKPIIFDKDISLEFNRKLTLFEIDVNNDKLNLMENYEFMNYFFNDDLTLKEDKKYY